MDNIREVLGNATMAYTYMDNIRDILGNATMAYTYLDKNVNCKKVVESIFDMLQENKKNIEEANRIDVKNNNGFKLDFNMINKLKNEIENLSDFYRNVISLHKNSNNYLEGKQTDNLGTICLVYDGNTYCLLEVVLKAILTHNSIIITSESDYMKGTNELIVILIKRILEAYKIDKNLVQILYTSKLEKLLSNSVSINKVICIGDRNFQNKIKQVSKIPVICKGYNAYDLYIEDLTHLDFVEKIIEDSPNIDIYVKSGLEVPCEDYIEVADFDEAIAQINFNSAGFSSCIFTDNSENASQFLTDWTMSRLDWNAKILVTGFLILTASRISLNCFKKYGCVVLVLHEPLRLPVRATFKPIKPFSGMYTGVSFPIMPATERAAQRNNNDRPRDVFSVPGRRPYEAE